MKRALLALAFLFLPAVAHASPDTPQRIIGLFSTLYVLPAMGLSSIGGLTTTSHYYKNKKRQGDKTAAERYFHQNRQALAQDIALGGGDSLREFSALAGVGAPDHARFKNLVRGHRVALLSSLKAPAPGGCLDELMRLAAQAQSAD